MFPKFKNKAIGVRCLFVFLCFSVTFSAHAAQSMPPKSALLNIEQFSSSIEALSARVSPSVVRILVTRFGAHEDNSGRTEFTTGRQESLGSGVIIDGDGYIITNAHVVEGAQKIRVNVVAKGDDSIASVVAHAYAPPQPASLVGIFKEGDLALIKIAASGLPALPLADYEKLHQGQVVFAFGSPSGLQNSVSMGIVSSIARQPDPDSPFLYIQTDTPINPGNSGGPLVNTAGEIVGLNTFILSRSGGNEGVGFAIPSTLVKWIFPQLKRYGHVHRATIGIGLQEITPVMASAIHLGRNSGAIISDVRPGGAAEAAGLKIDDILLTMNGRPIDSVPAMMGSFFSQGSGEHVKLKVLRGSQELSFDAVSSDEPEQIDRLADMVDPTKDIVAPIGILGVTVDKKISGMIGSLRLPTGVMVAARVQAPAANDIGLQVGDVVHEVNGKFVFSLAELKAELAGLNSGDPVAILIERNGQLSYNSFELP